MASIIEWRVVRCLSENPLVVVDLRCKDHVRLEGRVHESRWRFETETCACGGETRSPRRPTWQSAIGVDIRCRLWTRARYKTPAKAGVATDAPPPPSPRPSLVEQLPELREAAMHVADDHEAAAKLWAHLPRNARHSRGAPAELATGARGSCLHCARHPGAMRAARGRAARCERKPRRGRAWGRVLGRCGLDLGWVWGGSKLGWILQTHPSFGSGVGLGDLIPGVAPGSTSGSSRVVLSRPSPSRPVSSAPPQPRRLPPGEAPVRHAGQRRARGAPRRRGQTFEATARPGARGAHGTGAALHALSWPAALRCGARAPEGEQTAEKRARVTKVRLLSPRARARRCRSLRSQPRPIDLNAQRGQQGAPAITTPLGPTLLAGRRAKARARQDAHAQHQCTHR